MIDRIYTVEYVAKGDEYGAWHSAKLIGCQSVAEAKRAIQAKGFPMAIYIWPGTGEPVWRGELVLDRDGNVTGVRGIK